MNYTGYLPFPGEMVRERASMSLVQVSMEKKPTLDIRDFMLQCKRDNEL